MYGYDGPSISCPVHLNKFLNKEGEEINPREISLSKLRQEHFKCKPISDRVVDYLLYLYPPSKEHSRLLTWEETLRGIPGVIPSITVTTSAGYPYNLGCVKGKMPYIQIDGDTYSFNPEFLKEVEECDSRLRSGEQIEVIFADVYKDETLLKEKVDKGKLRLFGTGPLHYLDL
jgi:hypothetical protein